tara:strand:+ start:8709 stop:9290 length:582 start_codon:yes stop_codon:yes gene_type:complete
MIERIKVWVSQNRWSVSLIGAGLAFFLVSVTVSGCQVSDLISVDVPPDVKQAIDIEGDVTLTQIPDVWEDWQAYVEKNTNRLEAETDRGYELLGFVTSATNIAVSAAGEAAPAFPGGALLIGLLGGAAGLFMKKPGTDRAIAKEKEASYNAGMKKAEVMADQAKALAEMAGYQYAGDCEDCEDDCEYECEEEN